MKNHIKLSAFILFCLFSSMAFSQILTPQFSIKIAFEDQAHHKDTITLGYDSLATNSGIDTIFGEQNTWSVPWDSVFEARAHGFFYASSFSKICIGKRTSHPVYCYQDSDSSLISMQGFHVFFRCKGKNFPVTLTWDYTKFSGASCHTWSAIVYNSAPSEPSIFPVHRMGIPYGSFDLYKPDYYALVLGQPGYNTYIFSSVLTPGGGITADTVYQFEIRLSSRFDVFDDIVLAVQDQSISELPAKIYPNPARTEVNVSCAEPAWYQLYDLTGKEIYQAYYPAGSNIIDVSNIPKGMYILRLQGKNRFHQQKLMIE